MPGRCSRLTARQVSRLRANAALNGGPSTTVWTTQIWAGAACAFIRKGLLHVLVYDPAPWGKTGVRRRAERLARAVMRNPRCAIDRAVWDGGAGAAAREMVFRESILRRVRRTGRRRR